MTLPREISPNPLVNSTVELRFSSILPDEQILSKMLSAYLQELPHMEVGEVPKEVKQEHPDLKFHPDFVMRNDVYSLAFSNCVLRFEVIGKYPLWEAYFLFLQTQLNKFYTLGITEKFERLGLRYISILKNITVDTALKNVPTFQTGEFRPDFASYRGEMMMEGYKIFLQIASNAQASVRGTILAGLMLDIDASTTENIYTDGSLFATIDKLHTEEKKIFFSMLRPEFIPLMNPKY